MIRTPYDDCENSNETENEPDPTRADERVPIMLVPCGGASALRTERGDDTRTRAVVVIHGMRSGGSQWPEALLFASSTDLQERNVDLSLR